MKADIHPTYHEQASIVCSCGNTFTTGSTAESLRVDLCSKCHPFYTGQQKLVDTEGQVDRFMQRMRRSKRLQK
ncbi:MAG: 50S ribosomal protein L31 [Chloroflexi bacterium]|jgi:large subunit ribosomal protein L31|nr:50S ribosomal protein L31 [Chloroflexota bacterium]